MRTLLSRRALLAAGAGALPLAGLAAFWLSSRPRSVTKLVVAESAAVASALFYVARHQGYFAEQGLEIETVPASSGKEALAIVTEGRADLCMVAEAPFVKAVMSGRPVRIVATIESSERNTGIIVPAEGAIRGAADLRGRRIGYIPGTASEYFLAVYLEANSVARAGITAVELAAGSAHEALARGEVDGISGWQEIRARADRALGRRTAALYADGVYLETWNVAGLAPRLDALKAPVQGFVRALIKAQSFAASKPEAAIGITADSIDVDRATIAVMWHDYAFDVGLDQALISNLEGHWRMANGGQAGAVMPNLVANLDPVALEAADPGRITYFR